jgi:Protein of unknown function (DUF3891)
VLISRRRDGLQLVTQGDHAHLAGRMAGAWGNARFAVGPAPESLAIAATRHDDGWAALDGAPYLNAQAGRPAHFLEVPLEVTVGPYGEGVERIYAQDVRAGVLASMHRAGLWASRWGVQDSPPLAHPLALAVVAEEDRRVADHSRELWQAHGGLRSAFEAALWRDYEVLQALDLLSLALCLLDTRRPTDPGLEPPLMAITLRELDQPPGGRLVARVPAGEGEHADLRLQVSAPGVVSLDPFPFTGSAVDLELTARALEDRAHSDPATAYHGAQVLTSTVTLVPGQGG